MEDMLLRVTERMEHSNKSKSKYGFKRLKWITDTYGEEKGKKVAERKASLGLWLGCKQFQPLALKSLTWQDIN